MQTVAGWTGEKVYFNLQTTTVLKQQHSEHTVSQWANGMTFHIFKCLILFDQHTKPQGYFIFNYINTKASIPGVEAGTFSVD